MTAKSSKITPNIKELLMGEILSLDLPLFLLVDLSCTFDALNEYKIKNISYNKDLLLSFLNSLQLQYMKHIQTFVTTNKDNKIEYLLPEHTGLLTQAMLDSHLLPNCNAQESCSIKCLFSVKCLLMIKEYINKKEYRQLHTLKTDRSSLGRAKKSLLMQSN